MENQISHENNNIAEPTRCCGGKGQFIFNIAAGVLILVLVVLQFFNPFAKKGPDPVTSGTSPSIAYVVSDSIMNKYKLVDTLEAQLNRLRDSLDKDMTTRQTSFEARVNAYQQNMQNGKITTIDEAKRQESQLAAEQEQLMNMRDLYLAQVQQLQLDMNMRILDSIQSVVKRFPDEFPYDYVLGYTKGAGILYAAEKFDITDKVVAKMNEEYEDE